MKHLRITFTDKEFIALKSNKESNKHQNWHDYVMSLAEFKSPRYTGKYSEENEPNV